MIPALLQSNYSAKSVDERKVNELNCPVERFNSIAGMALLSNHLRLDKIGWITMLPRNLQPMNGHVNGSCCIVEFKTINVLFFRLASDKSYLFFHAYHKSQLKITCQSQTSNEPRFSFEIVSQERPTKQKFYHSVMQFNLICITNASLIGKFMLWYQE